MAKSINFRSFNDDGTMVSFSSIRFRKALRTWQATQKESTGKKTPLDDIYRLIADKVHVSPEAVRNWDRGQNGVNDFSIIKDIARIMEIDYKDLIVSSEEPSQSETINVSFEPVSNNEKDLIMQFYQLFIDFIYFFCGNVDDCYAYHVMENPYEEQNNYISKLYHLLDQSSLSISRDTYLKLRKTVAELNIIANVCGSYAIYLPESWIQVNQRLDSSGFRLILTEEYEDINTFLGDDKPTGEEKDSLFHMMIEDIPDIIDAWSSSMYKLSNNKEREMVSKIADGFCTFWHFNHIPPLYEIVVHELSYTLTDIMRSRFPQYFGEK